MSNEFARSRDFMWHDILQALCLVLVIEGMIPFLQPARWRQMVARLAAISDSHLRWMGFISMFLGAVLLYLLNVFSQ